MDSRSGLPTIDGQNAGTGAIGAGMAVNLPVLGRGGVPLSGVGSVALNVTATNPTIGSFLTVWPTGSARPVASNLNFVAGETIPNMVIVPVGANGQVSLFNASGSVDVIVDVLGWFPAGSAYTGLNPARLMDSRLPVDAPLTWSRPNVDSSIYSLEQLSCPSVEVCYASGTHPKPLGFPGLIAVTFAFFKSSDGGVSWKDRTLPIDAQLNSLYCADVLSCVLSASKDGTAHMFVTTDGANTWAELAVPTATTIGFNCSHTTPICLAVADRGEGGNALIRSTDFGRHWAAIPSPEPGMIARGGATCSGNFCLLGLNQAAASSKLGRFVASDDGGNTWRVSYDGSSSSFIAGGPAGAQCQTPTHCLILTVVRLGFASESYVGVTSDAGHTWKHYSAPEIGVCRTSTSCLAGGAAITVTSDQWRNYDYFTPSVTPNSNPYIAGIDCPLPTHCVVVGEVGTIAGAPGYSYGLSIIGSSG